MNTKLFKLKINNREGYYIAFPIIETMTVKNYCLLKCCKYGAHGYVVIERYNHTTYKDAIEEEEIICDWNSENDFISADYSQIIESANFYTEMN